jgi:hypothetical protein
MRGAHWAHEQKSIENGEGVLNIRTLSMNYCIRLSILNMFVHM